MAKSDDSQQNDPFVAPASSAPPPSAPPPPPSVPSPPPSAPPPPTGPPVVGYGAGYPPYAPPQGWRRSWSVTMARWGVGSGVALFVALIVTITVGLSSSDPYAAGYVAGTAVGSVVLYLLLFPWWLDHVTARAGRWGVFAIHGGLSLFLALLAAGGRAVSADQGRAAAQAVPAGLEVLVWVFAFPLATFAASKIKNSFAPRAVPASSTTPTNAT